MPTEPTSAGHGLQPRSRATPQKIPRPPNAFMIFANEWRKKLARQNPRESNKEISVRLGGMWKSMVKEVKDKYFSLARQVDAEHKRKYPDYVYNPKEARIRKAMRDQASRARAVHHQHQRQHQGQHHHHQAQNRQQYMMPMGGRNDIITRTRLNPMPRQPQASNVQQNHKISHLCIPPHILHQKPNQIHIQQVNQGMCNDACNQQWMVGIEQRQGIHIPQQEFIHSQEQHYEKTKAAIRQQVEHGILDGVYTNFVDMEAVSYPTTRVVEVTGIGQGDGFADRSSAEERTGMGSHVTMASGQEFTVYTDIDGHQHWYPYVQANEVKVINGGSLVNHWNQHHEHQSFPQSSHHHMQNDNHDLKMPDEHQLFPMQCLIGPESSNPLQVSPNDDSRLEAPSQVQQYLICPPSAPEAKFITQTKEEVEDIKENPSELEMSHASPSELTSSAGNDTTSNAEELGERNPDSLPLPAFQQAFGSTEIGRFANEGFLNQSPEAPSWSDPSSPYGLSSPPLSSNPAASYYFPSSCSEELTTHAIAFPQSLSNYFDCSMLEEIEGSASGYGDLVGLVGTEGSNFDFLTLHVPPSDYTDRDGDTNTLSGNEEMNLGLNDQESNDLLLLAPINSDES
ncbi:uncharacterized protein LOC124160537 isoform X2 [Ischnura elegans]|uniref:uncharacterized protein LOC124160537 isoform X2 n=1 Tax=Ischnura elegans TaxID=197161 RepID=UPI001ED875FD|nr:uncharacterized protein LOC124160537 isoform X2 [Ischnura elegans]